MAADKLWVGVIMVALGAFFLMPSLDWGFSCLGHSLGRPPVIHFGSGHYYMSSFIRDMVTFAIRTVMPLALIGLGIFLVARSR
jgi:hypothetical protein